MLVCIPRHGRRPGLTTPPLSHRTILTHSLVPTMTEDKCGYPTANGDPCQHPASEGDSCWIDSHGGDTKVGRDFALSEDDHDDILDAAREGLSKSGCARAAGVSHSQLNRYLEAHADFRSAFMRARSDGERSLVQRGLFDDESDSSMAKFLLSTSFEYVKTEKKEVEMDAEVDRKGGITADFIAFTDNDGDE